MLAKNGEQRLQKYAQESYPKKVYQINERIRCYVGYGHSNCIVIEGDSSLILIDSLDSDVRAEKLREELAVWTDKPVGTIIFTHGHPDHRGGSAAFADTVNEVIAFAPKRPVLKHMDQISELLNARTVRQFGYHLTELAGAENLLMGAKKALENGEYQLAVLDADLLLLAKELQAEAKEVKIEGLRKLAGLTTCANARHYYMEWIKEQK